MRLMRLGVRGVSGMRMGFGVLVSGFGFLGVWVWVSGGLGIGVVANRGVLSQP